MLATLASELATRALSTWACDLLAVGDTDLRPSPLAEGRARLGDALADARSPSVLTPVTDHREQAARWPSAE
jgi:ATP-dependent DNA ligase